MRKQRALSWTLLLASATIFLGRANADSSIKSVNGHVEDMVVSDNCGSPVGVCTVGRMKGGIQGDLAFSITSLSPSSRPGTLIFTAESTISTAEGDIFCSDSGSFNSVAGTDGEGVHLCEITGGTGQYAGASGYLQEAFNFRGGIGMGDYVGKVVVR